MTPDVQDEFDRMKAAGGIVVAEPYEFEQAPGSKIATFEDPDGNYFQLMTPSRCRPRWTKGPSTGPQATVMLWP